MSERPFMQLYVSDFLGDTLELSTEGIGAYMLLLMAMWNAGGTLPDDDGKLARITRMSVKRWRAVAADLLDFFERDNGRITHQRLSKELQKSESKSQSRASAGAEGGRAKALKDKNTSLASATGLPQHLPDTRDQKVIEPIAQRTPPPREPLLFDKLCSAAGFDQQKLPHHKLLQFGAISDLIGKGYSLEADILPAVRDVAASGATFTSWSYFVPIVTERVAKRDAIPPKPAAPVEDWKSRMHYWHLDGTWATGYGPKPGEPGCRVPPELQTRAA
jgi:uncharacterized protein YdaU (DUF1376 family)